MGKSSANGSNVVQLPLEPPSYHARVKEEKRQAAMAAAMEVFLEQGYERASLQQIASRADVSTATLFKRFPTKAALFEAIVMEFWNGDAEISVVPPAGNPKAGLRKIGTEFATLLRRQQVVAFFRVLMSEVPRFPELGRLFVASGKLPYLNRLNDYLKSEVEAGQLKIADIPRAGRQFLAMISDQVFWPAMMLADFAVSDGEAKQAVEEAITTILARYGVAVKAVAKPSERPTRRAGRFV